MTQHIILFVNKKGKEVDRINFNSPTYFFWGQQIMEDFKKNYPERYKHMMKFTEIKKSDIKCCNYKFVQNILGVFVKFHSKNEIGFDICTAEKYKQYGAVNLIFKKEHRWTDDGEFFVDTKKKYDYVIYGLDDGGEFDKDTKLYDDIIDFIKMAIKLESKNE